MKEILKEKRRLNEILAKHTGRPLEQIEAETERNRYFTAQEAKEFGLVDEVLVKTQRREEIVTGFPLSHRSHRTYGIGEKPSACSLPYFAHLSPSRPPI